MADATVEHDFLGLRSFPAASLRPPSLGIQGAMSRISPALLMKAMASSAAKPPTPTLPVLSLASSRPVTEKRPGASPLTILYNGAVAIFDLPADKAEEVIKIAAEVNTPPPPPLPPADNQSGCQEVLILRKLKGKDLLPVARRNSLKQFLEKRRERLATTTPYATNVANSGEGWTCKANSN